MKALTTTLGLFLLSLTFFSFAPQQATATHNDSTTDLIQLQSSYDGTGTGGVGDITKEENRGDQ